MRWSLLVLLQLLGIYVAYRGFALFTEEVTGTGIAISEFGFLITPPYFDAIGITLMLAGVIIIMLPFVIQAANKKKKHVV
ncbi:hypothetical protein P9302_24860 [Brevibacillus agri]|uniref:hypothetical protein n=1 Tax=Brevibacillus agri TaxID=51101 RepID=UPI002E1E8DA8|nr:hypothetical protein [Brevibacillus agri]